MRHTDAIHISVGRLFLVVYRHAVDITPRRAGINRIAGHTIGVYLNGFGYCLSVGRRHR